MNNRSNWKDISPEQAAYELSQMGCKSSFYIDTKEELGITEKQQDLIWDAIHGLQKTVENILENPAVVEAHFKKEVETDNAIYDLASALIEAVSESSTGFGVPDRTCHDIKRNFRAAVRGVMS